MPVWLRVFYIKRVEQVHKDKNKEMEKANKKAKSQSRRRR